MQVVVAAHAILMQRSSIVQRPAGFLIVKAPLDSMALFVDARDQAGFNKGPDHVSCPDLRRILHLMRLSVLKVDVKPDVPNVVDTGLDIRHDRWSPLGLRAAPAATVRQRFVLAIWPLCFHVPAEVTIPPSGGNQVAILAAQMGDATPSGTTVPKLQSGLELSRPDCCSF